MKEFKNYPKIKNKLRTILLKKRFRARLNHNHKSLNIQPGSVSSSVQTIDEEALTQRLKKFYKLCDSKFAGNKDSMWSGIFMELQGDIHNAFINDDDKKISHILQNPAKYNLFYGFENMCKALLNNKRLEDLLEPEMTMDSLITLCEAVGVLKIANPESLRIKKSISVDEAIELLESKFDFNLLFPNPFKEEYGLKTKNGIASYRAIQAIYQAWKVFELVKDIPNPKILEIGGGLGRTAFYCNLFGIKNYTIVDIPMSLVSQTNFLSRALSQNAIHLMGEPEIGDRRKINLIDMDSFFENDYQYDLIINVDSLVELDKKIATNYFNKVSSSCQFFFSINHENNSFSVNDIWESSHSMDKLSRSLYWLRRGYVEELFQRKQHQNNS